MALQSTIAHQSTHAAGAADALTPADIGAVKGFVIDGTPNTDIAPMAMELGDSEVPARTALKCDGTLDTSLDTDNPWSVSFPDKFRAAIGAAPAASELNSPHVARAAMQLWDPANDAPALKIEDSQVYLAGEQFDLAGGNLEPAAALKKNFRAAINTVRRRFDSDAEGEPDGAQGFVDQAAQLWDIVNGATALSISDGAVSFGPYAENTNVAANFRNAISAVPKVQGLIVTGLSNNLFNGFYVEQPDRRNGKPQYKNSQNVDVYWDVYVDGDLYGGYWLISGGEDKLYGNDTQNRAYPWQVVNWEREDGDIDPAGILVEQAYGITINGNVGIGTETPTERLEVSGNVKISNQDGELRVVRGTAHDAEEYVAVTSYGIKSGWGNSVLSFEERSLYSNTLVVLNWGDDASLSVGERTLKNLGAPVEDNDAVRKVDLDGHVDARLPLSTSSYIIAQPGDNLADKYNAAKLLQPNGVAKSSSNRAALIILPGTYNLTGTLTFDAEFVDVIGLGSCFQSPAVRLKFQVLQSLSVSANNIRVVGIEVLAELNPANSKPLQVYENCKCIKGFGARGEVSGTFIGCIAEFASFGSTLFSSGAKRPVASGTYIRCKSGPNSFASGGLASGKFTDCEAGYGSFGGDGSESDLVGEASGEFINCKAEDFSFGVNGAFLDSPAASGVFTNCSGGLGSFGGYSHASGTFTNCSGGFEAFRAGVAAGKYIGCRADSPFSLSAPPSSAVVSYNGVNWISIYSTANPGTKFLGPSNFREGDCVIFSGLVGGAPLQNGVPYYVTNASLNVPASNGYPEGFRFQVSGQQGGSVISMTSNIVFGRVRLLAFQQNCIDMNGNIFEGQI
jgi:hypothetical protein